MKLVVTVGNEMMGDDAAGPLLARKLLAAPLDAWELLEGGSTPENHVHRIREMSPERVVIVDAAEMDMGVGESRVIEPEEIGSLFLVTTHTLPLNFFMEALGEFVPQVSMIGIQPGTVAFGYPVSAKVEEAVERVYRWLKEEAEILDVAEAT